MRSAGDRNRECRPFYLVRGCMVRSFRSASTSCGVFGILTQRASVALFFSQAGCEMARRGCWRGSSRTISSQALCARQGPSPCRSSTSG